MTDARPDQRPGEDRRADESGRPGQDGLADEDRAAHPVGDAPGVLVEAATWPPVRTVVTSDGWRVGVSGGFTRRANSALPLGRPADLPAAVARVEAAYDEAGLPPVFRVGGGAPAGLAAFLAGRGYAEGARTDVLVRSTAEPGPAQTGTVELAPAGHGPQMAVPAAPGPFSGVAVHVADEPGDAWLRGWLGVRDGGADIGLARAVLAGAPAQYLTAALDGEPVGTLRIAYAEQWAALSCLAVAPGARRRGLGTVLTRLGLALAGRRGVPRAFLQVEADNTGAVALYGRLGFVPADGYRYLVGPGGAGHAGRPA